MAVIPPCDTLNGFALFVMSRPVLPQDRGRLIQSLIKVTLNWMCEVSRSESRQKTQLVQVRCTPLEKQQLKSRAAAFGSSMSVGELCRSIIFGSQPKSMTDQVAIVELAHLRADLGRMGGLLKGWLSGSFIQAPPALKSHSDVIKLLKEIDVAQQRVLEVVEKVHRKSRS